MAKFSISQFRIDSLPAGAYFVPDAAPSFSYLAECSTAGFKQKSYRIYATDAESGSLLWDSGTVESDISVSIPWGGKKLRSRQIVNYKITVTDSDGDQAENEASFEVTLLDKCDWQAKWICNPASIPVAYSPAPYFRNVFSLKNEPVKARLYITARGIFEAHINGQIINRDRFVPGWTNFHKHIQFMTYDVTGMLSGGKNALGAIVGDGWYTGFGRYCNLYGPRPELLMQLEVTFADGSTQTIISDEQWKCAFGAIFYSDIYDGEHYDARLELDGWDTVDYDDNSPLRIGVKQFDKQQQFNNAPAHWQPVAVSEAAKDTAAELCGKLCLPVREIEEIKPVRIISPRNDLMIWDFGQNITGNVRMSVRSFSGRLFTLRYAEMLNDDMTLYTANYRGAKSTDHYVAKGGQEKNIYEPKFTFHGFRYVQVEGFLSCGPAEHDLELTAVVIHSDLERTGNFSCSNPKLNQLYSNTCWGQRDNFLEVPTDCPQRDERLGWTGDAEVFCPTASTNYNVWAFFRKYLRDMREAQFPDGGVAAVAPDILDNTHDGAAWSDAAVICPWVLYQYYGDRRILEENYDMMVRWVEYQHSTAPDLIRPNTSYGDWLSLSATETPSTYITTIYFRHTANLLGRIAAILGKTADAEKYSALSENIVSAFRKKFLNQDGSVCINTQTAYVLALHFNMLSDPERQINATALKELIENSGNTLTTGFVGTASINLALSESGLTSKAYDLYLQEEFPSWLYSVNQGATTIWERWNSFSLKDGFGDANMNSFNHYAYGAVHEWVFSYVCGIRFLAPAGKELLFAIEVDPRLEYAGGSILSQYGKVSSYWKYEKDLLHWSVSAPPNTTMTVKIPDGFVLIGDIKTENGKFSLPCGSYELTMKKI